MAMARKWAGNTSGLFEAIDLCNGWMIERCEQLGFALEAGQALDVLSERRGQHLDRHVAIEPDVRARCTSPIPPAPIADWIS